MSRIAAGLNLPVSSYSQDIERFSPLEITTSKGRDSMPTIDREIDSTGERRQRNKKSISILDFPPEVLCQIFVILRDGIMFTKFLCTGRWRWIRTTSHICRYWRQVALDCPELWSFPRFSAPEQAEEMLRRSKRAPLAIDGDLSDPGFKTLEDAIADHSRVQWLRLRFGHTNVDKGRIFRALCASKPILESLSLHATGFTANQMVALPENAFRGSPRLRHIHCEGVHINWKSPSIRQTSLTTLQLQYPDEVVPFGATVSQLLDVLVTTPHLQVLELHYALCAQDGTSPRDYPLARLKSLESLIVTSRSAAACGLLLHHLRCSSGTKIEIRCSKIEDEPAYCNNVVTGVAAMKHSSDWLIHIARLKLSKSNFLLETFETLTEENTTEEFDERGKFFLILGKAYIRTSSVTLDLSHNLESEHQASLFESIFSAFNLNQLESLLLLYDGSISLTRLALRQSLGYLPNLHTIQLVDNFAPLCSAIYENPEDHSLLLPEGETHLLHSLSNTRPVSPRPQISCFRSLKRLILKRRHTSASDYFKRVDVLVNMVTQRHQMSAPIERLVLDTSVDLDESALRRLCEAVPNVAHNGRRATS